MLRTRLCKQKKDRRLESLKGIIAFEMERKQLNNEDLAKKLGVSPKTIYTRRSYPETFRLSELLQLFDLLEPEYPNYPDEILRKTSKM